jgi:hypothetical protein
MYLFAMADFEYQNRDFPLLSIANEAIVAVAISPWSALLAWQSFARCRESSQR